MSTTYLGSVKYPYFGAAWRGVGIVRILTLSFFFCIEHSIHQYVIRDRLFCVGAWRIAGFRRVNAIEKRDNQLHHVCLPVRMENFPLSGRISVKSDI